VSSTLSPKVLILAENIDTLLSKNTLAILASSPWLSEVSIVMRFLPLSLLIEFEIFITFSNLFFLMDFF
jgi:hypothetical protein